MATPGVRSFTRTVWLVCVLSMMASACSTQVRPDLPVPLELGFVAAAGLNPTADGRPSPALVRVFELAESGGFAGADFFSLMGERGQVVEGVLDVQEFMMMPGELRVVRRRAALQARYIGIAVAYRDLEGSVWRSVVALPPPHQAGRLWSRGVSPERRYRIELGAKGVSIAER